MAKKDNICILIIDFIVNLINAANSLNLQLQDPLVLSKIIATCRCWIKDILTAMFLNLYPSFGWGKGGNVTSAGWQVILCDPIWHVSSRSGEASCELLYSVYLYL